MLPLAQVSPPPAAVASWLEVLFYLAGGTAGVVAIWYFLTGKSGDRNVGPQPFIVKPETRFATKAELEEVKQQVAALTDKIERGFIALDEKRTISLEKIHTDLEQRTHSLRKEIKDDTNALHSRITDVLSAVSELRGRAHHDQ